MTRAIVIGLALIMGGGGVAEEGPPKQKIDFEDPATLADWRAFGLELAGVRQQLRAAKAGIGNEWRQDECRFQSLRKGTWTEMEEDLTAQCALMKWPATSWDTLDRIIDCESGWRRTAFNPSGPFVGLGQHALSSWAGRLATYRPDWGFDLRPNWRNSRTMLVVTVRMMMGGLSPWSCA